MKEVSGLGGNAPFVFHLKQNLEVLGDMSRSASHSGDQGFGESGIGKGVDCTRATKGTVAGEGHYICVAHRPGGMRNQDAGLAVFSQETGGIAEFEK